MDPKKLFDYCVEFATLQINQTQPEYYSWPTPDTEWDVKALAGHILYELSWVADIVQGKTIAEVGTAYDGDLVDGDLQGNWRLAARRATEAVSHCDLQATAHLSYADVTNEEYVREAAADMLIHGWDLATALKIAVRFDPSVAQAVYDTALPRQSGMAQSGMFAPAVTVAAGADIQTKLLALYGRQA